MYFASNVVATAAARASTRPTKVNSSPPLPAFGPGGLNRRCALRSAAGCGVEVIRVNVKRFRGGLVFKAHRLAYHSTLGW